MDSKCIETRRELITDPKSKDPELLQHLASCAGCANYLQSIKQFDNKLSVAMKLEVPEGLESRIILAKELRHQKTLMTSKKRNHSWLSMAAGILLVFGLSIGMFRLGQVNSLENKVLAHVYNELVILEKDENIQLASLNGLLNQHGVKANDRIGYVRFAENCPFGDHVVPHLILENDGHIVTVMYLSWETLDKRTPIDDKRFEGVLVPAKKGVFVILSENQDEVIAIEDRVISSIEVQI